MERQLEGWFDVDAATIDLRVDLLGTRVQGSGPRALTGFKCPVATALEFVSLMQRESIEAVRLKTERVAQMAGEPGAVLANCAPLMGVPIHRGRRMAMLVLPPRDDLATAVVEAGGRARERCLRAGDDCGTRVVEVLEAKDTNARGFVHVGFRCRRRGSVFVLIDVRPRSARLFRSRECADLDASHKPVKPIVCPNDVGSPPTCRATASPRAGARP